MPKANKITKQLFFNFFCFLYSNVALQLHYCLYFNCGKGFLNL